MAACESHRMKCANIFCTKHIFDLRIKSNRFPFAFLLPLHFQLNFPPEEIEIIGFLLKILHEIHIENIHPICSYLKSVQLNHG